MNYEKAADQIAKIIGGYKDKPSKPGGQKSGQREQAATVAPSGIKRAKKK
tara:strand:- start:332 stop:481 length:150 start_codon:yes stop_codon:yes gene_type:complete